MNCFTAQAKDPSAPPPSKRREFRLCPAYFFAPNMPDENIHAINEINEQPPDSGEDMSRLSRCGDVVATDSEDLVANADMNEPHGNCSQHQNGVSSEVSRSNQSKRSRAVLAPMDVRQTFQAPAQVPSQPQLLKKITFELLKQPKEDQENYCFMGRPGRIPSNQYYIRQHKRAGLKLTRRCAHERTRRHTVQKARRSYLAERRSTIQSIIRGVSHVKSCSGCSRMLCRSTRTLIRRCEQHVQTCPVLDCSTCTSCKIARMVQVAWQAAENNRIKPPTQKCRVCVD